METFYRVQDREGIGPYQQSSNLRMISAHGFNPTHPPPAFLMGAEDRCGFRTMQDLYAWFGGWLPGLVRKGYRIAKVSGTVQYEDPYQVVFRSTQEDY